MDGRAPRAGRRDSRVAVSLRERLAASGEWVAEEGVLVLTDAHRKVRLRTLARRGETAVLLCDPPRGAGMPPYLGRRRLCARLRRKAPGSVVVFMDAAATERVWGRYVPLPFGGEAYRERGQPAEEGVAVGAAVDWRAAGTAEPPVAARGARAARRALLERLRRRRILAPALARMSADAGEALLELIETSRSPDVVRLVWRELEEVRVLDPVCGDGEWLSGCLEGLVGVGESCLCRMRAWVEDQRRSGERCRPEKLADFKRLLGAAAELDREGGRERLVRETVLLRCLRGVERDPVLAAACRRRLAAGLEGGLGSEAEVELTRTLPAVREGTVEGGIESAEELAALARLEPSLARGVGEIAAEAAALLRVERQLTRMRLHEAAGLADLIAGLRLLRARRTVLGQALSARLAGRGTDVLHPWVEYPEAARNGGFDLVRRGPEDAAGSHDDSDG